MELTDNDLMLAVRDGDVEAFGVLFDRHHQRLWDFFYRLSCDAASSEDLVQDVFLRMFKYRNTFGPKSEFRGWMYHIARTARVDRFRSERRERVPAEDTTGTWLYSRFPAPDYRIEQDERSALMQRALLQLPDDKRELLVLARFQEMKYEQIASLLEVEVGTVKVRVHRAIAELREIYRKLSGEKPKCDVKTSGKN